MFFRDLTLNIGKISTNIINKYVQIYVEINEASIKRVSRQLSVNWRDVVRIIMIEETIWEHEDRTSKLKTNPEAEINQTE